MVTGLLSLTLGGWALLELSLRVREGVQSKGGTARDRATRILIAAAIGTAIVLAMVTAKAAPSPRISGPTEPPG